MSEREDKELQKYLDGDSPVGKAYRNLGAPEPGAALDAQILAAARTEAQRPVRPGWMIPLAVAASVMLGVGLSIRVLSPFGESAVQAPAEMAAGARPAGEADAGDLESYEDYASPAASVRQSMAESPEQMQEQSTEVIADAARDEGLQSARRELVGTLLAKRGDDDADRAQTDGDSATAFAPPPPPALADAQPEATRKVASDGVLAEAMPATVPPVSDEDRYNRVLGNVAEPAAMPSPDREPPGVEETEADDVEASGRMAALTEPSDADMAAAEQKMRAVERDQSLASSDAGLAAPAPPADSPSAVAELPGYRLDFAESRNKEVSLARFRVQSPKTQLEIIEEIWSRGDKEQARELMAAFRLKYPDYVLPESFPLEDPADKDADTPATAPPE